jgi:hypothetical protein
VSYLVAGKTKGRVLILGHTIIVVVVVTPHESYPHWLCTNIRHRDSPECVLLRISDNAASWRLACDTVWIQARHACRSTGPVAADVADSSARTVLGCPDCSSSLGRSGGGLSWNTPPHLQFFQSRICLCHSSQWKAMGVSSIDWSGLLPWLGWDVPKYVCIMGQVGPTS